MLKILVTCVALVILWSKANAAPPPYPVEWTAYPRYIANVLVDPSNYYIRSTVAGWGPPSCATVLYIVIARSQSNARELLSLILSAKATGRPLIANGQCNEGSPTFYFDTNYLQMY